MNTVKIEKEIKASPQEVWDIISDIEKAPDWVEVMNSLVDTTDNPVKKGTVYKERSKVGPKESVTTWRVTKFVAPQIQIHECNEPDFKAHLTMKLEPTHGGTKLTHITKYELMPNLRPLGWLLETLFVKSAMIKNLNKSVDNCKAIIEAK
ncbi:MAG: SRPBCC family protein [Saprospiraceae bacterium]|nr:SRPBCC family protein [Saprospiraceae bacterium]